MQSEQREVRNKWLAEKSEMESKLFHLQALVTQIEGTSRKKEKDFEKLQAQLSKLNKDSNRGVMSIITISKPIQKNLSQTKSAASLKDAEINAVNNINSLLEVILLYNKMNK